MTALAAFARGRPLLAGAISLFLILAAAYTFSIGLRASRGAAITGDEPFYLLTTQSLLQDGDLDLTQQYAAKSYESFFDHPSGLWKQSVPTQSGQLLSPHEPGLSVLLLPGFGLAGLRGAQVELLLVAALTFALAYVIAAAETGAPRVAWCLTAAAGLSATPFVYATEIYPEVPAALCLVASLLVVRQVGGGVAKAIALALLLSAFAWFGAKYVPLGALIAVYYLWGAPTRERFAFLALAGASGIFYVWFHLAVFDHLTAYNVNTVYEGAPTAEVLESHLAFQDRFYRIWGLFIDRRFGLGHWAPLFLPLLPALPLLLTSSPACRLAFCLILSQVLIATFVAITMMGFWFPGRTLMTVLPLAPLVLTLLWLRLTRPWRGLLVALGAYSLWLTGLLVLAVRRLDVTLASNPFELQAWPYREAGRLFPQYTSWTAETWLLNCAWLALGLVALVAINRRELIRLAGVVAALPRRLGSPRGAVQASGPTS